MRRLATALVVVVLGVLLLAAPAQAQQAPGGVAPPIQYVSGDYTITCGWYPAPPEEKGTLEKVGEAVTDPIGTVTEPARDAIDSVTSAPKWLNSKLTCAPITWIAATGQAVASTGIWFVEWARTWDPSAWLSPFLSTLGRNWERSYTFKGSHGLSLKGAAFIVLLVYAAVLVARLSLIKAWNHFVTGIILMALSGYVMLNAGELYAKGNAATSAVVNAILVGGVGPDVAAEPGGLADASDAMNKAFGQDPWMALSFGGPLPEACAAHVAELVAAGDDGGQVQKILQDNDCDAAYEWNAASSPGSSKVAAKGLGALIFAFAAFFVLIYCLMFGVLLIGVKVMLAISILMLIVTLGFAVIPGARPYVVASLYVGLKPVTYCFMAAAAMTLSMGMISGFFESSADVPFLFRFLAVPMFLVLGLVAFSILRRHRDSAAKKLAIAMGTLGGLAALGPGQKQISGVLDRPAVSLKHFRDSHLGHVTGYLRDAPAMPTLTRVTGRISRPVTERVNSRARAAKERYTSARTTAEQRARDAGQATWRTAKDSTLTGAIHAREGFAEAATAATLGSRHAARRAMRALRGEDEFGRRRPRGPKIDRRRQEDAGYDQTPIFPPEPLEDHPSAPVELVAPPVHRALPQRAVAPRRPEGRRVVTNAARFATRRRR